jgi:hypothetical protein
MTLAFLNPWLWLGALSVAAPIWLHLRRKKERNLVRFSAVRFLEDEPHARASPLRIHSIWLLLCRILAVLLIAAAFSWPYLHRPPLTRVKESVVYILDNTLSHQANEGFRRDRDRLVQDLAKIGAGSQAAVIELASVPRVVGDFGEDSSSLAGKIRQLQPSCQRGSYLAAFREANELLSKSAGQRKRIVFLGDNQANQWNENAGAPPFLRSVRLDLPRSSSPQLPNLWLSELRAQRILSKDKSMVNFEVRLGHLGPAHTARVAVQVNDKTVFNRTVELDKQPESILLQAECEADPATWLRAEASVEGVPDSLAADNRVFCAVPPVLEGKVALLAESAYLRAAFSPDVMRGHWTARWLDFENPPRDDAVPENADVLCLESAYLQTPRTRALLAAYLSSGRGVLLLVNRLSPSIDGCLRELGFEPERMLTRPEDNSERFQFVVSSHPIFQPFQSADFGDLMGIRIHQYARLRAIAARPLIFSETGDGLFFESTKYSGKLFVCAFGLDRSQTDWPVDPTFIPFLDLALQAARPGDSTPASFDPGSLTFIQLPKGVSARELVLRDKAHEMMRSTFNQGRAEIRMPSEPGFYTMTLDAHTEIEKVFCVNPPAKESELKFVEPTNRARQWSLDCENKTHERAVKDLGATFSAGFEQHLWWWLALGSLLALALETVLACGKESSLEASS